MLNLRFIQYLPVIDHITYDEILSVFCLFCSNLKEMAASIYIVVAGEDPGFDIFVNGHALARNEDALEKLAGRLKVSPLLEFFPLTRIRWRCCWSKAPEIRIGLGTFLSRNGSVPPMGCKRYAP